MVENGHMTAWICLFRGINVGGRNIVKMAQLRSMLTELGCAQVATYIQSGNVVFVDSRPIEQLELALTAAFESAFGFPGRLMLIERAGYQSVIHACPYIEAAEANPKSVHTYFLQAVPSAEAITALKVALARIDGATERFRIVDRALYLHAPDGFGKSKFAAKIQRTLQIPTTARNWRSLRKIQDLAAKLN